MFRLDTPIIAGTAQCDFQVTPLPPGDAPRTDWERELLLARRDGPRRPGIRGAVDPLPDFRGSGRRVFSLCAGELGAEMFRTSLDFGRLCPAPGDFDVALMAEYVRDLVRCRLAGLEPMLTLHHWPMPLDLCQYQGDRITAGGWEHPAVLERFRYYVDRAVELLFDGAFCRQALAGDAELEAAGAGVLNRGPLCTWFVTINEPIHHLLTPYILGIFPPYRRGAVRTGYRVLGRVADAHEIAYQAVERACRRAGVASRAGVAHNFTWVEGNSRLSQPLAWLIDHIGNWDVADRFEARGSDFVGIQYYFRQVVGIWGNRMRGREFGDHPVFGDLHPEGIRRLIEKAAHRYGRPVVVTEFGFADRSDRKRPYYILETIRHILEAVQAGATVEAILLWTTIDNLEWVEGMDVPFGLYDFQGQVHEHEGSPSSREVWGEVCRYLRRPVEEGRRRLESLRERALAQIRESADTRGQVRALARSSV